MPILEPEVDIHSPQKADAEKLLHAGITAHLDALPEDRHVMLKLTLPSVDDFYADLVAHPRVLRVVALSGGYSREEADAILARQHGVVASFSRALVRGAVRGPDRRRVPRHPRRGDHRDLRGVDHLTMLVRGNRCYSRGFRAQARQRPSDVPVEWRFSHASTTRSAMPASASFRYVRGS